LDPHHPHQQVVDDAYFAFVWSLVVCQSTVRVGTVPDGATTEVYIAPQQSQKRKSKEKDRVDGTQSVTPLTLLPDARSSTFDDLQSQYGDALRISVDAHTSFAAITGSHIRVSFPSIQSNTLVDAFPSQPPKLTPMVYTALQFITRGREHGISTVDLGKKTGYDQKTCFYLIKQLLELELVVKLRRGGVGTNFCIHKYFFEHSPLWRQIQGEGENSSKEVQADEGGLDNEETVSTQDDFQAPIQFDPIDARHLSSLSLIQSRIVKLLKHSKSYTHPSQNLLVTIVSKPLRFDLSSIGIPLSGLSEPYQN
jgi:oxalate---CoA ligase